MEDKQLYPNFIQAVGLMCMIFIGAIIFSVISGYLQIPEGTVLYTLIEGIAGIFICYFPISYAMKKNNMTVTQVVSNYKDAKGYIIPTIILMVGVVFLLSPLYNLLIYMFYSATRFADPDYSLQALLNSAFLIISTPILEEVLFRGITLKGFINRYGVLKAVSLSSILFALMHINPEIMVLSIFFGMVFSYLYIKTRSIYVCIIAHIITNIMYANNYIDYFLINGFHFNQGTFIITGIIFAAIGLYLFNKAYSRHHNEEASTGVEA